MNKFLIVACLVAVALASDIEMRRKFVDFQQLYGRQYATQDEFEHRFRIFQDNMNKAADLQAKNPKATFGMNKFSDISSEEFAAQYLMNVDFKNDYVAPPPKDFTAKHMPNARGCNPDPTNYDWDSCGVVTPIYNQGECGSCWAFSATETIESYNALAGNTLVGLSMSQIVDCDTSGQDEGCSGGFPSGAYTYVESAGGIESLADYPYSAESGESGSCQFNSGDVVTTVTNYNSINGETGLYSQLSSSSGGPVSVCVDASSWQTYTGGVLSQCGTDVDHCVQCVGYANYGQSGAYWIVRNSWGASWGESGFIYLAIGQDLCSIGDYATVVTTGAGNGTMN
jgi:C1A family cysteine protease